MMETVPFKSCKAEDPVTFEEVVVRFTKAEWAQLRLPQKTLYREVMLENYGMVISIGSGRALERDSRSFSFHPGVEIVIMESAEGLEDVMVHFTSGEWALMDPGQKALYEEVTFEINAMVSFLEYLKSRPDVIAFLEENGEDLSIEGPVVEEGSSGKGPSEASLERLIGEECEEAVRIWHEAKEEGKNQALTLREKSSPRKESKHQTQMDNGKKGRPSSEAGEALSSRSVLEASQGIDRVEKSLAQRINLSCNNFYRQEMPVGHWRNHARGTSSTASYCGQNVSEESRTSHVRFHQEEKVCKCPDCGKTFSVESDLSQHWITHTGENQKTEINRHQKDRTRVERYRPPDNKKFDQSKPNILHETLPPREKPYQCLHCTKAFTFMGHLRRHEKSHTGEKSYHCSDCGKTFCQRERLSSHRRVHTGERPYQCSECGKSCYAKEALSWHQRIHAKKTPSGELPNECLTCGKIFRSKSDVVRHQTVHTREKPYMCPDCGKHFSQSGYLATHRRIHTGETPHQCVVCGKSFRRRDILILHQRIHTGQKPYLCSECGKSFCRADVLYSHQKIHRGEKPFACFECGKTFSQGSSLTSHHNIHVTKRPLKSLEGSKIERINRLGSHSNLLESQ